MVDQRNDSYFDYDEDVDEVGDSCRDRTAEEWRAIGDAQRKRRRARNVEFARTSMPGWSTAFQARRAGRLLTRYFNLELQQHETPLRSTQVDVLAAILSDGGASDITGLAARMGMARSTLSHSLSRLAGRGLVTVRRAHRDKRRKQVLLTEEGTAAVAGAMNAVGAAEINVRNTLTVFRMPAMTYALTEISVAARHQMWKDPIHMRPAMSDPPFAFGLGWKERDKAIDPERERRPPIPTRWRH